MAKCCLSGLVCEKPFIQKLGDLILSTIFLIFSQFHYAMPLHLGAKPISIQLSYIDMILFSEIIEYLGYSNLIFEFPDGINSPALASSSSIQHPEQITTRHQAKYTTK